MNILYIPIVNFYTNKFKAQALKTGFCLEWMKMFLAQFQGIVLSSMKKLSLLCFLFVCLYLDIIWKMWTTRSLSFCVLSVCACNITLNSILVGWSGVSCYFSTCVVSLALMNSFFTDLGYKKKKNVLYNYNTSLAYHSDLLFTMLSTTPHIHDHVSVSISLLTFWKQNVCLKISMFSRKLSYVG